MKLMWIYPKKNLVYQYLEAKGTKYIDGKTLHTLKYFETVDFFKTCIAHFLLRESITRRSFRRNPKEQRYKSL
jgi:hypothetical protein